MIVTEARPSIEFFRQSLNQQSDLVVVGDIEFDEAIFVLELLYG